MNLYILRHAIAVERGTQHYPNDDRPLTQEGIDKMKREAQCFPALIGDIDVIFSSPLSRARETAAIAAKSLRAETKIKVTNTLLPEASELELLKLLADEKRTSGVMIVGHEPLLSSIASLLLGNESSVIELKKGALCLIEISGTMKKGAGILKWLLQPKQLRAITSER